MRQNSKIEEDELLYQAVLSGIYPPNTTAEKLAQIRNGQKTLLHLAAQLNHLPPGTNKKSLIETKDINGRTPLHEAAKNILPPGITAEDLATAKSNNGWTALHEAAHAIKLPNNTAKDLLIHTKDNTGESVLETSVVQNKIPETITALDLLETNGTIGRPLLKITNATPMEIRNLLDRTTCENHQQIKQIAEILSKKHPTRTALWMAQQLQIQQKTL